MDDEDKRSLAVCACAVVLFQCAMHGTDRIGNEMTAHLTAIFGQPIVERSIALIAKGAMSAELTARIREVGKEAGGDVAAAAARIANWIEGD